MKKIIKTLSILSLLVPTSLNLIACNQNKQPIITKKDLNDLSINSLTINKVIKNNLISFYGKLVSEINQILDFSELTNNDVELFKKENDKLISLTDNDIINGSIEIVVQAKNTSERFKGEKNISVQVTVYDYITKKDLNDLSINSLTINKVIKNNLISFYGKLVSEINQILDFSELTNNDVELFKKENDKLISLTDNDIINGSIEIVVQAKNTSERFKGKKNISVQVTVYDYITKKDLNDLSINSLTINKVIKNNLISFSNFLINAWIKNDNNFSELTNNDVELFKKENDKLISLTDNDIINGSIEIVVQAKNTSERFKGEKNISVQVTVYDKYYNSLKNFLELALPRYQGTGDIISLNNFRPYLKIKEVIACEKINMQTKKQELVKSEVSTLKNNTNLTQSLKTQDYSKSVTNSYSVTNSFSAGISEKIKFPFDEVDINFNFSHSETQTTTTTSTITSPSQSVTVSPHHKVKVVENLFNDNANNNCILKLIIDQNSYFTGNVEIVGNNKNFQKYKTKYTIVEILNKFSSEFKNKNNNNLIWYKNDTDIHISIPITIRSQVGDLNLTIDPEEPLK